jgi:hypothetical protein
VVNVVNVVNAENVENVENVENGFCYDFYGSKMPYILNI